MTTKSIAGLATNLPFRNERTHIDIRNDGAESWELIMNTEAISTCSVEFEWILSNPWLVADMFSNDKNGLARTPSERLLNLVSSYPNPRDKCCRNGNQMNHFATESAKLSRRVREMVSSCSGRWGQTREEEDRDAEHGRNESKIILQTLHIVGCRLLPVGKDWKKMQINVCISWR